MISPWQLLIILIIVVLLFGTKKLRNMGGDLGAAFKNFKKAVGENDEKDDENKKIENTHAESIIEGETIKDIPEKEESVNKNGSK